MMVKRTKTYTLSPSDLKILMALDRDPLGTYESLAEISGTSKSSVHKIIYRLEHPPGRETHPFFTITANLNLSNLKLVMVDLIAFSQDSKNLINLIKVGLAHPYTAYQTFIYGSNNGMFFQFHIPENTTDLLIDLFENLKIQGICEGYKIIEISQPAFYTTMDVKKWDAENNTWFFSWSKWFNHILSLKQKTTHHKNQLIEEKHESVFSWIKMKDLAILRELTVNARRKNTDLIQELTGRGIVITPQTFGRRLKKIIEECCNNFRVTYHQLSTEPLNPILLIGEGNDEQIRELTTRIKTVPFPFRSIVKHSKTSFMWVMYLPSSHIYPLLPYLRHYLNKIEYHYLDSVNSYTYYFYYPNFDENQKSWKKGRKYMVDSVLEELESPNFLSTEDLEKINRIFGLI